MIIVAADHFGIGAKQIVTGWLAARGTAFEELGSRDESDEQSIADFIPLVAERVLSSPENRAVMICGTGIGVDIGANRFKGIRSVLAGTSQIAEWSRSYDDSNVLCLSGWGAERGNVEAILERWFSTPFEDPDGSKRKFLAAMDRWT